MYSSKEIKKAKKIKMPKIIFLILLCSMLFGFGIYSLFKNNNEDNLEGMQIVYIKISELANDILNLKKYFIFLFLRWQ